MLVHIGGLFLQSGRDYTEWSRATQRYRAETSTVQTAYPSYQTLKYIRKTKKRLHREEGTGLFHNIKNCIKQKDSLIATTDIISGNHVNSLLSCFQNDSLRAQ